MENNMDYNNKFVRFLLETGALIFGEFTLKSGRSSPYMINTGKLDTGATLARLGCFYARSIYEKMEFDAIPKDTSILFGSAYKGIPLAAATAIAMSAAFDLDVGYAFNRKEAKDHGEGGVFVGKKPGPGDRILIIDDVMTAGTALRDTVDLLGIHAPEAKVIGSAIAVDRKERGRDSRLSAVAETQYELGIPIFSIIDIDEILTALKSDTFIEEMSMPDMSEEEAKEQEQIARQCYFCGPEIEGAAKIKLPTQEQIAAIEAYLEENRPK